MQLHGTFLLGFIFLQFFGSSVLLEAGPHASIGVYSTDITPSEVTSPNPTVVSNVNRSETDLSEDTNIGTDNHESKDGKAENSNLAEATLWSQPVDDSNGGSLLLAKDVSPKQGSIKDVESKDPKVNAPGRNDYAENENEIEETEEEEEEEEDGDDLGSSTSTGTHHRKKRIQLSSAAPSIQLVILVVGAVLGCVLLTGFIRWRVKRRLEAKKMGKVSRESFSLRSKRSKTSMATIYECDCEENGSQTCHAPVHSAETRLSSGNRSRREQRIERSSSMTSRGNHGHRTRPPYAGISPSTRLSRCVESDTRLDQEDVESSSRHQNIYSESLLLNPASTERNSSLHHPPLLLMEGTNPSTPRNVLTSLLDTWRSLSFNRDWVGKRWLERHNVRRISDVLRRNFASQQEVQEEENEPENLNETPDTPDSGIDMDNSDTLLVTARIPTAESETSTNITDTNNTGTNGEDYAHAIREPTSTDNSSISAATLGHANLWPTSYSLTMENSANMRGNDVARDEDLYTDSTHLQTENYYVSGRNTLYTPPNSHEHRDSPPHYTLLVNGSLWNNANYGAEQRPPAGDIRRSHVREMAVHHYFSRTPNSLQECSNSEPFLGRDTESRVLHANGTYCQHAGSSRGGDRRIRASPSPVTRPPTRQFSVSYEEDERQNLLFNQYATSTASTATLAQACSPLEIVVIEQLDDGSQIIYMPPPSLPSYHDDHPPPYQQ